MNAIRTLFNQGPKRSKNETKASCRGLCLTQNDKKFRKPFEVLGMSSMLYCIIKKRIQGILHSLPHENL